MSGTFSPPHVTAAELSSRCSASRRKPNKQPGKESLTSVLLCVFFVKSVKRHFSDSPSGHGMQTTDTCYRPSARRLTRAVMRKTWNKRPDKHLQMNVRREKIGCLLITFFRFKVAFSLFTRSTSWPFTTTRSDDFFSLLQLKSIPPFFFIFKKKQIHSHKYL